MKIYSHLLAKQPKGKIYPEGFDVVSPNVYNFDENRLHEGFFFFRFLFKFDVICGLT